MDKNFKIKMKSKIIAQGESDEILVNTDCVFHIREGNFYIMFDHFDEENDVKIKTTIIVKQEFVLLNRGGSEDISSLRLIENQETNCKYPTAIGLLDLAVFTKKIDKKLCENGGRLRLRYTLFNESKPLTENDLQIEILPMKG